MPIEDVRHLAKARVAVVVRHRAELRDALQHALRGRALLAEVCGHKPIQHRLQLARYRLALGPLDARLDRSALVLGEAKHRVGKYLCERRVAVAQLLREDLGFVTRIEDVDDSGKTSVSIRRAALLIQL